MAYFPRRIHAHAFSRHPGFGAYVIADGEPGEGYAEYVRADLAQRVPETLTAHQLDDTCLSYRHDFGLMTATERDSLRREAADWWRCFERALNHSATKESSVSAPIIRRMSSDLTEADYERAIGILVLTQRGSTSLVQRELTIGYNAAASLIERAESDGILTRPNSVGKRHVLARPVPPKDGGA